VVPVGRLPWLDDVGRFLPLRNGLLAVRAIIAGRLWGAHLLLELLVGAAWAALAVAGFSFQVDGAPARKNQDQGSFTPRLDPAPARNAPLPLRKTTRLSMWTGR